MLLHALAAAVLLAPQQPDDRDKWLPPLKTVTLEKGKRAAGVVVAAVRAQTGLKVDATSIDETAEVDVAWDNVPVLQALDDLCRRLGQGHPGPHWRLWTGRLNRFSFLAKVPPHRTALVPPPVVYGDPICLLRHSPANVGR